MGRENDNNSKREPINFGMNSKNETKNINSRIISSNENFMQNSQHNTNSGLNKQNIVYQGLNPM